MRIILAILILGCMISCHHSEPDIFVPNGFVLQPLDPTDGKIARPKGWYYSSGGTPSGWMWTISEEDSSKGGYETGLRMQLLVGVQKETHHSTEEFALNFLQQKRAITTVLRECQTTDQGEFKRQCLEVLEEIEGPHGKIRYHILYSVFWGKEMDMVFLNTFGAPEQKWESVRNISDTMSHVVLIGPNFGKNLPDR